MHGANPGLVSHLVKQALLQIAADFGIDAGEPRSREAWGGLAAQLQVKVIHVSERDHQTSQVRKRNDEFVNTWSSEAFCGESLQPAELGWGTHERNWPHDGREYGFGSGAPRSTSTGRAWPPARAFLGAARRTVPRLVDIARRGDLHSRLPLRARERQGALPADLPLRLPPLRRRSAVAAGIRRQRLALSAAPAPAARRDRFGLR